MSSCNIDHYYTNYFLSSNEIYYGPGEMPLTITRILTEWNFKESCIIHTQILEKIIYYRIYFNIIFLLGLTGFEL